MNSSRTLSTISSYRRRVDQIRRQIVGQCGYEAAWLVPPMALIEHLINRKQASEELVAMKSSGEISRQKLKALEKHAFARASWRQYKAAVLFVFEEDRSTAVDVALIEELDIAIQILRAESQSGCLRRTKRTSGMKLKGFPAKDFDAIVNYLQANIGTHRHADALLKWLRASRIVGVRPSEWRCGRLITVDGIAAVCFENAKTSNGRGNGKERILLLDEATSGDIDCIGDLLNMLNELQKDPAFDLGRFQLALGSHMRYATRRCLGKRSRYPTMYSLRHQFAADAKVCFSLEEVAALLGHGVDCTATTHYGRKAAAQSPLKVSPTPSQVATVRRSPKSEFRPNQTPDLTPV